METSNCEALDLRVKKNRSDDENESKFQPKIQRPAKKVKRLQRMRPAEEKLRAIERIRGGETKASVARKFNVPESTIRGWCKSEETIRRYLQSKSLSNNVASSPSSASPTSSMEDVKGNQTDVSNVENSNDENDSLNGESDAPMHSQRSTRRKSMRSSRDAITINNAIYMARSFTHTFRNSGHPSMTLLNILQMEKMLYDIAIKRGN